MTLRLLLSGTRHVTIISAYAPTMTNPDEVKNKFYDDLDSVISAEPRRDKFILLGDFNARVGTDHQTWEGVIGTEGVGKCNSNGLLILRKCAEHELLNTNTVFRLPTHKKASWMHPRSKYWHLTDYVIVRRKDRQDVRVPKTMDGQTVRQITGLLSANSTCAFSLYDDDKAKKCQRHGMSPSWNKTARSIRQWYLQPLRCTETQFRRCKWELGSLQRHRSLFSKEFPRTSISQTPRLVWWVWQRNPGTPWRETPKTQGIPQWYQRSI